MRKKYSIYHGLRIITFVYTFCVIVASHVYGQATDSHIYDEIIVNADSVVQLYQHIRINYEYNTLDPSDKIISPSLDWSNSSNGYSVIEGPKRSYLTSVSVSNGTKSYKDVISYVLYFTKEGTYTLPQMNSRTETGKRLVSKLFRIRATKDDIAPSSKSTESARSTKENLLAVEMSVNKNHVCLGDSIECDVRLYYTMTVKGLLVLSPFHVNSTYWKECELPEDNTVETVNYNGNIVSSKLLQKFYVVPMQTGTVTLEPMEYKATYETPNPSMSYNNDPFELFFNSNQYFIKHDTTIKTSSIELFVDEKKKTDRKNELISQTIVETHNWGLVIDRSSSLLSKADSLAPSFMDLENLFVEQLLGAKELPQPFISLFAGKPHYPTSLELANITGVMPSKGNESSAIYNAVLANALGQRALTSDSLPYSILLLTDGSDNSSCITESTLTNLMLQNKIRVDVVAFGNRNDLIFYKYDIPFGTVNTMIKNPQDFNDVEEIAKATNGIFILIENKEQIPEAISRVKDQILHGQPPIQEPNYDFHPDNELLNRLYKGILLESETEF